RDVGSDLGVVHDRGHVGRQAAAAAELFHPLQHEGGHGFAGNALFLGFAQRPFNEPLDLRPRNLGVGGDGVDDDHAFRQAQLVLAGHLPGDFLGRVGAVLQRQVGFPAVKRREYVGTEADDGHGQRLEHFQRGRQVEKRLGAAAHHGDPGHGDGPQVRRDVQVPRPPSPLWPASAPSPPAASAACTGAGRGTWTSRRTCGPSPWPGSPWCAAAPRRFSTCRPRWKCSSPWPWPSSASVPTYSLRFTSGKPTWRWRTTPTRPRKSPGKWPAKTSWACRKAWSSSTPSPPTRRFRGRRSRGSLNGRCAKPRNRALPAKP